MRKIFLIAVIITFCFTGSYAQRKIQSSVYDATNNMVMELAAVRLLNVKDSSLVAGVQSDTKGSFVLPNIRPGNYILLVTSLGYNDETRKITMADKDLTLRRINLTENTQMLQQVEIKGTAAQLVVKGDTLEYNATAFKTQENAAVEDLLKKLPGVEINEGKITVNGEEITNIRVDGKKFFSGDVEQAVKNLPADMIEKIQVLEQKSDMAQLTGFEDENTERIINLSTKPNRRRGVFGKFGLGGGVDTGVLDGTFEGDPLSDHLRYDGSASLNLMTGSSQTTINAGANNINQARGGGGRGGWGGGTGITNTQNLGMNNNTLISDKLKLGGDLTANHSNNVNENFSNRESYVDSVLYTDITDNNSIRNRWNTRARFESEWNIDTLNTLIFQPRFTHEYESSLSDRDYTNLAGNDSVSWGNTHNEGFEKSVSGSLNVIYNRKFASKKGRSLTVNLSGEFSQSDGESTNISDGYKMDEGSDSIRAVPIDQFTQNTSDRYEYRVRLSYVEPLWNDNNKIEIAASFNSNSTKSVKNQFEKDANNEYTVKNDTFSNNLSNTFYRESLELNYRYSQQYYNLTLGINAQPSQTRNNWIYGDGAKRDTSYSVLNFSPNGRFQYNFGRKTFARFDYRGRTQQPSINQMQPVRNNSDPLNETVGNPNLQPSFRHNFRLMFSKFFEKSFSSFNTFFNMDFTQNALVSNRIYDNAFKQYRQTVNAQNIPVNMNWSVMYNTPLISKLLHFNTGTSMGYNTQYSYVERGLDNTFIDVENLKLGASNRTANRMISEELSLNLTQDVVELGLRGNVRYSNSINSLRSDPTNLWNWSIRANTVITLPYKFTISSDIAYSDRAGYANMEQSEIMWNAAVDKLLFNNRLTVSLRANDILRQRLNIRHSIEDNTVSYTRYNTLPAYCMLSLTYQLNSFGRNSGNRGEGEMMNEGGGRRFRGGEGGGMRGMGRGGNF